MVNLCVNGMGRAITITVCLGFLRNVALVRQTLNIYGQSMN